MTKSILSVILTVFFSISLFADPVQDLIKKSGDTKDYPGADLLVIYDSTLVDVQETGLSYVSNSTLYKVLTPAGALKVSTIKFDYDPQSAFVEIKKAVIYKKDGEIIELDVNKVMDYPAPAYMIYWGARQKMIEIGRLEPGDAVEVEMFRKGFTYALLYDDGDDKYIPPMKGHFYDIVEFWSEDPVREKYYEVKIPESKTVQYKVYNGEMDVTEDVANGKKVYSFCARDITKIKREPHMVAFSDIALKLLISTSPDWESKSRWFYGVNEDYGSFKSTPEIDEKVAEILEGAKDEMDSVSRLTHWVADNMRYSGISMGEGEGFTLHSGDMNFTDRCGVCKDKAGMLVTMLRAAGFESYPAMTMAGSRIDRIPADQFNHCVTIAKLSDNKYHLLDPTWVPFVRELWSSREQQQNYLMGLPEGADLKETPLSPPEDHYFRITGVSELHPDGTMEGEFTLTAEGQSDATIRGMFVRSRKSTWDSRIRTEIFKISPGIQILELDYGNDPYDYSDPVMIKVKYKIPGYALVTDEEVIFTPVVARHLFKNGMSHLYFETDRKTREYPFRDRCSRLVELQETVSLPEYNEVVYLPDSSSSDGPGASFEGGYALGSGKLILNEKAVFKKRVYEPEDWESFREAVASQNKYAEEPIILRIKNID